VGLRQMLPGVQGFQGLSGVSAQCVYRGRVCSGRARSFARMNAEAHVRGRAVHDTAPTGVGALRSQGLASKVLGPTPWASSTRVVRSRQLCSWRSLAVVRVQGGCQRQPLSAGKRT
jgi:hypothetical protein